MSLLEWAVLGAILLGVMIYSAKIMKRGLTTLDEERTQFIRHISEGERKLAEDSKNISAHEQLYLMRAALEDFLRLENCMDADALVVRGNVLELHGPEGNWEIELLMRERMLASTHRVLHGQSRWVLRYGAMEQEYVDISRLMAHLNAQWHGYEPENPEPEHISRRLAHARKKKNFCA